MGKRVLLFFVLISIVVIGCRDLSPGMDNFNATSYVDPFIGTGGVVGKGHGNTFPGASYPFGMIQLSPDNGGEGWEYCAGYHYPDSVIAGFSHTHLSGTGVGDLADISMMPTTKSIDTKYFVQDDDFVKTYCVENGLDPHGFGDDDDAGNFKKNFLLKYRSRFSHHQEKAAPGYYYVKLLDDDIDVELTASEFVGMQRYTFHKLERGLHVILDLGFHINRDKPTETFFKVLDPQTIVGYRFSTGWAHDQKVYFAMRFSRPWENIRAFLSDEPSNHGYAKGQQVKGVFSFDGKNDPVVLVKTGISSANIEGALADLNTADKYGWDFDKMKSATQSKWNDELGKIRIISGNEAQKTTFYTALYHCYIAPNRFSDVNGNYKGYNGSTVHADGYDHYTVLSLWDTFRALDPLLALMQPSIYQQIVKSMLSQYTQTGALPYWELEGNEGGSMIGYHAVPVIADALFKQIGNYDKDKVYRAMVDASQTDRKGLNFYRQYHFVPTNKDKSGTVSKTVEYAYDDWCIAQVAQYLGEKTDYEKYMKRSEYYRNLYDPAYKLLRGKNSDGSWYEPFQPRFADFGNPLCVEGNTWQYSFFVPQNIPGLIDLMGGKKDFEMMLDSLFTQTSELLGEDTDDVTGMIGQYAQGNEPSHHVAYLYDFTDNPYKTQFYTNKIIDSLYTNTPSGLCGNEDCGQMSAWYVFSTLGFYPVNPIDGKYYLGSPQFEKVELKLPSGKKFTIVASGVSDKNIFIRSARLNGHPLNQSFITYDDIMKGGLLEFRMSDKPIIH